MVRDSTVHKWWRINGVPEGARHPHRRLLPIDAATWYFANLSAATYLGAERERMDVERDEERTATPALYINALAGGRYEILNAAGEVCSDDPDGAGETSAAAQSSRASSGR